MTIVSGAEIARQIEIEEGVSYTRAGIKKVIGRGISKLYRGLKKKNAGTPIELFLAIANHFNVSDVHGYQIILRDLDKKYKDEIIEEFRKINPKYVDKLI